MAKVKLNLKSLTDAEVLTLGNGHIEAMDGNPNFVTPEPDAAEFATATATYQAALAAHANAQAAAEAATVSKNAARDTYEGVMGQRASYVDRVSGGDDAKALSSGFDLRDQPTPIGDLPAPTDFLATMGDMPGEIDLSWDKVDGANAYLIDCKKHTDEDPWQLAKPSTASKTTISGLESGVEYAFRVAAVGAAGQGPWSDESVKRVP